MDLYKCLICIFIHLECVTSGKLLRNNIIKHFKYSIFVIRWILKKILLFLIDIISSITCSYNRNASITIKSFIYGEI